MTDANELMDKMVDLMGTICEADENSAEFQEAKKAYEKYEAQLAELDE